MNYMPDNPNVFIYLQATLMIKTFEYYSEITLHSQMGKVTNFRKFKPN